MMLVRMALVLAGLVFLATIARAEFLRIEVAIRDMDCQPCSESLSAAFQRMRGVESAEVDFKASTVRLTLAEKNRVGIDQVWDAIKRVGFTPGDTKVNVRGSVKSVQIGSAGNRQDVRVEWRCARRRFGNVDRDHRAAARSAHSDRDPAGEALVVWGRPTRAGGRALARPI